MLLTQILVGLFGLGLFGYMFFSKSTIFSKRNSILLAAFVIAVVVLNYLSLV